MVRFVKQLPNGLLLFEREDTYFKLSVEEIKELAESVEQADMIKELLSFKEIK